MELTTSFPSTIPPKRIWGFWPTVGFSAVIFIAYSAAQFLVSLVAFILQISSGASIQQGLENLIVNGLTLSLATIVSAAVGLLLVIVFIRVRGGISSADYLGIYPLKLKTIMWLVLLFIAMLATVLVVSSYLGNDGSADFNTELYRHSGPLPLFVLAIVFAAPLFEEVFFRGFLFVGMRASRIGPVATIIITSALWAMLHLQYNIFGIVQIFVMGIILGIVRHRTDSLWSPLLIHILWNGAAVVYGT